ncbi:hypothetical protein [Roseicella frigidaeris]|uniref:hypothetical protein n=1 Tax=Roseicella frigidaeris TaxID=2230885 RepID=UPI000FDCDF5F|nr:hypothetical protein [Roseicella frigidaeris]
MTAALAALAFTFTAASADAAGSKHHGKARAAASEDTMADQLNAQSLARAQAGTNSPGAGSDTTGSLNRMSEQDAAKGKAMPQPPMPFR